MSGALIHFDIRLCMETSSGQVSCTQNRPMSSTLNLDFAPYIERAGYLGFCSVSGVEKEKL